MNRSSFMRRTRKIATTVLMALPALSASITMAQSPRAQLEQLAQELRAKPSDQTLRERIIKLGASIKPQPVIPEEANRREGRAKFAFRNAKSAEDWAAAAQEYELAVAAAPWVAGYYVDLCTIYEKTARYADAKRNCEFALLGATDAAQINEIRQRIAGLEYGIEKATASAPAATVPRRFILTLNSPGLGHFDEIYEIEGNQVKISLKIYRLNPGVVLEGMFPSPGEFFLGSALLDPSGKFQFRMPSGSRFEYQLAADGASITKKMLASGHPNLPLNPHLDTIPQK